MAAVQKAAGSSENELPDVFEKHIERERRKKEMRRLCLDLAVTAAAVFVLFRIVAGIAVIRGNSMEPNLTDGSAVLFYRLEKTYRRNDIVIFKTPGTKELLVKRIAAVAGDRVDIDNRTGTFTVNGVSRENAIINGKTYKRDSGVIFPLTVPGGCVFVLGDNREIALDSRSFGAISVDRLVGKVVFEVRALKGGA